MLKQAVGGDINTAKDEFFIFSDGFQITWNKNVKKRFLKWNKISKKAQTLGITEPKILVPMELRHLFFTLLSNYIPSITVLTREEIGCNYGIEIVANI